MRRIIVGFSLAALTLLLGSVSSTSATNYSVSLSCSDGTVLTETLGPAAAADLADAVTAINTNPAGLPPLTCTLSQTAITGSVAQADSPHYDWAVGGGKV